MNFSVGKIDAIFLRVCSGSNPGHGRSYKVRGSAPSPAKGIDAEHRCAMTAFGNHLFERAQCLGSRDQSLAGCLRGGAPQSCLVRNRCRACSITPPAPRHFVPARQSEEASLPKSMPSDLIRGCEAVFGQEARSIMPICRRGSGHNRSRLEFSAGSQAHIPNSAQSPFGLSQFSTLICGTRSNSFRLSVTTVSPSARA